MKSMLFAVRDRQMNAYMAPFCAPTVGVAIRMFTGEVNRADANNMLNKHPEDFDLWCIATFDDLNGQLGNQTEDATSLPTQVCVGKNVFVKAGG